jgi:hypothetical protein
MLQQRVGQNWNNRVKRVALGASLKKIRSQSMEVKVK